MLICALLWLSACLCCCLPPYSSISVLSNVFLCRPFSFTLYFDIFHVCYRLLSSAPKPLPAQIPCSKILHHDWLLWRQTCPALPLWPVCLALPCPALIGGYPPRYLSVIGCDVGTWCSSPKYGLLAGRYHFCEKCFNEIQGESVSLGDDPSQPQT